MAKSIDIIKKPRAVNFGLALDIFYQCNLEYQSAVNEWFAMLYVTVNTMLILDKTIVLWGTNITGIPSVELEQDRQERK